MPSIVQILTDYDRERRGLLSRKQSRAYQRVISGLFRAEYRGERVYFLTLTSSDAVKKKPVSELNASFNVFLKRFRRFFGEIEYYSIRTDEGNGVLHMLFKFTRGEPMGFEHYLVTGAVHAWASVTWDELHASPVVWINETYGTRAKKARYLVQYLSAQSKATWTRISTSMNWIFKGACRRWTELKHDFLEKKGLKWCIVVWNAMLKMFDPVSFSQPKLTDFYVGA